MNAVPQVNDSAGGFFFEIVVEGNILIVFAFEFRNCEGALRQNA